MRLPARFLTPGLLLLFLLGSTAVSAQWSKKAYTEWSEKDAQKVLDDSPWGQTQVVSNTSRMLNSGPPRGGGRDTSYESSPDHLNFRIRLLSSRPIRQAFSRLILLKQKDAMNQQLLKQLQSFAAADFPDYVIVAVAVDAKEQTSQLPEAMSLLQTQTTSGLKNNTYIITNSGQRVFLQEFQPPKKDGLGAKFIFPRNIDGKAVVTEETGDIKFYSELSKDYILDMRFKLKDMTFNGKLEY